MKWNKLFSLSLSLVLILLMGHTTQAQSEVSRKSSQKVLKESSEVENGDVYQGEKKDRRVGEVEKRGVRKGTKEGMEGKSKMHKKEGHPGKGNAYGKYKNKKGKAKGKYKNKKGKGARKAKSKAGKRQLEQRKVGKAYYKSRKTKSLRKPVESTSRKDIPVQGN